LVALLWAAAQNPITRRWLPTIIAGATAAFRDQVDGGAPAGPADLPALLEAVRSSYPSLGLVEDFIPANPRQIVRWRSGDNRWRIDPGLIEDPIGIMKGLDIVSILDDEVVDALGFGIADLQELALRYMDRRLSRLEECWAQESPEFLKLDAATSTEHELALLSIPGSAEAEAEVDSVLRACASPEQAERALAFATVRADRLKVSAKALTPLWGETLAIQIGRRRSFVPSSLVLEGLDATANRVADRLSRRRNYRDRRQNLAKARLGEALRQTDADVLYPVDSTGSRSAVLLRTGNRHGVVLDVVSSGSLRRIERDAETAKESLSSFRVGEPWVTPVGPIVLPEESEVMRLVVVDGPGRTVIDTAHRPLMIGLGDLCDVVGKVEDAVELWEFLSEVTSPPMIGRMASPGLPELWELWKENGTFNPNGFEVEKAAVGWETELQCWNEAAEWEPFDRALASAGLPSSAHSTRRAVDGSHDAQVWSLREPRHMRLIHVDPDLVVEAPLDDLGPLDPELVVNFAGMFLLAVDHLPAFRTAVAASGAGLRIAVLVNSEPPESDAWTEETAWVTIAGWVEPTPCIEFGCDYRLLVLLAHDAKAAVPIIGEAIGQGLKSIGVSEQVADGAIEAWRTWRTPFRTEFTDSAPKRPFQFARSIRPYDTARVRHDLARHLKAKEFLPGTYDGDEAVQMCDGSISPALLSIFMKEIKTLDKAAMLNLAANEIGAMHAERRRDALMLRSSMLTDWANERRYSASVGEDAAAKRTRASQLACELILGSSDGGSGTADRIDWAHLLAITGAMLDIATLRSQSRLGLQEMELVIDEQYGMSIFANGESSLDILRFDVFRRLLPMRPSEDEGQSEPLDDDERDAVYRETMQAIGGESPQESVPFESLIQHPDCPDGLRQVDHVMQLHLGTGFDAILATLRTAGSWDREGQSEFAVVPTEVLAQDAASWSKEPLSAIKAAISLLTLRSQDLVEEGNPYWLVDKRRFRLTTRPFMETRSGNIRIIPELATAVQNVFARYFVDGRLPWPDVPNEVLLAMRRYRQGQNRQLEQMAEEMAQQAGFAARRGLTPAKAAKMGVSIPSGVGEIDLLVADAASRRLWVIEVKDLQEPFAPHEMWSGVEEFVTRYVPQLEKKVQAVSVVMADLLNVLGVEPTGEWSVEPLFVTSRVVLAAFDIRIAAPFVVVDDLVELLQSPERHTAGLFIPTWAMRVFTSEGDEP
jgi:hypothetical protein